MPPAPVLPGMSEVELTLADLWATRISPDDHPVQHLRPVLDDHDVVPIGRLGVAYAERLQPLSSVYPEARGILPSRHRSRDFH